MQREAPAACGAFARSFGAGYSRLETGRGREVGAHRLNSRLVERIWGRRDLAGPFAPPTAAGSQPIGEIWFEGAADAPLLVKYLFTSARLSIQVHPDDAAAR